MKFHLIVLFLLLTVFNSFGQTGSERFIDGLVGKWISIDPAGQSLCLRREGLVLAITETAVDETGRLAALESKIYLDGRLQKDGLKQPAVEARTVVKDASLTTIFYALKDGKIREWFRERITIKNGRLVIAAQVKTGIPFLAAGTKRFFQKSN